MGSRLDLQRHLGVLCAAMLIHLLVLNYDGRQLLAECLPSVLRAAAVSKHECQVAVIDNASRDDSLALLAESFPAVRVIRCANRGLCSFNEVLESLSGPVAVLLNNDVKLDPGSLDPLVEPLLRPRRDEARCFMTAPLCWGFDGRTYEGLKTAVQWRWGLVQATSLFPGHEAGIHHADCTASAGAVLAVDRRLFLELGGFDEVYLPGRLEDLDFAYRGFQAGYEARYVPEAVAYHLGFGTFEKAFGREGCERLALRNTLLFQWKNLRHPEHWLRQAGGLSARLLLDVCRAPLVERHRRFALARAVVSAAIRVGEMRGRGAPAMDRRLAREREFFRRFAPGRLRQAA